MNNRTQLEYIFRQLSALPKITDMERGILEKICAFEKLPTRASVKEDPSYSSGEYDEEQILILKRTDNNLNLKKYFDKFLPEVENLTQERRVVLENYLRAASEIFSDAYDAVKIILEDSALKFEQRDADYVVPLLEESLRGYDSIVEKSMANFLQVQKLLGKDQESLYVQHLVSAAVTKVCNAYSEKLTNACATYKDSLLKRVAEETHPNEKFLDDQVKIDAGMTRYMDKSKKPTLLCRAIDEVDGYKKIRSDQSDPEVKIKKMQTYIEKMTNNKVITQDKHQDSKNFVSVLKKIGSGLQNAFKTVKRATKKFFDNVKTQTPLVMDDIKNKFRAKS